MLLNRETFRIAFAEWEQSLRDHPEDFYTPEEVSAMSVADVSSARAIHMIALLRAQEVIPPSLR